MNITENSKQLEYLMTIRNIGMQIIFKKAKQGIVIENLLPFEEYIEDKEILYDFVHSIAVLDEQISNHTCTPDDLLLEMGQYTPHIKYDDSDIVNEGPLYNDDEGWLYT